MGGCPPSWPLPTGPGSIRHHSYMDAPGICEELRNGAAHAKHGYVCLLPDM
jgi:hypothetical protein